MSSVHNFAWTAWGWLCIMTGTCHSGAFELWTVVETIIYYVYIGRCVLVSCYNGFFLGVFMQLWTAPVSFMSVGMEHLSSHWMHFHDISYLSIFQNSVTKIEVELKSDKNEYLTWRPAYILILSLSVLIRMGNVSDRSRENQNKYILYINNFVFENHSIYEIL